MTDLAINPPPMAYVRSPAAARLAIRPRLLAGAIALTCLAVLIVAATLTPSPDGMGTHRGLGLAECGFYARFGLPCFSCGMTTSFAWFVRGNLLASLYVQPMGCLLAIACSMAVWGGLYIALTGRPTHRLLRSPPIRKMLLPAMCFGLAAWAWKIAIHAEGIDGWR